MAGSLAGSYGYRALVTTLDASYARCRDLNRSRGATYYAATLLLPRVKRHHVHALYGFCRQADEVVDALGEATVHDREAALNEFGARFFDDLDRGDSDDLVFKAVVHTVSAFDINPDYFRRYLRSMTMDLSVTSYETFDDLLDYMDGAAVVVGEMVLPILEPTSAEAFGRSRDLSIAFQLTDLLRDVADDLARDRVYLPQEDLRRFGVDPRERAVTTGWEALVDFEIRRIRGYYESGQTGFALLPPASARCVRAIARIYRESLDRMEKAKGDLFGPKLRVPAVRKAMVVGQSFLRLPEAKGPKTPR